MANAIQIDEVAKRFGETVALDGVSFGVPEGTVMGLLGPNGAGKTTLVRILATLETPGAGSASIGGLDVVREARGVRRLIGLTGQFAALDEDIPGQENLILVGRLLNLPARTARARAAELLEQFGLTEAGKRVTRTYSGGMRRRLDLAVSLVGRPRFLFLDEPTTGLDPQSRLDLWKTVRVMTGTGVTVLLTTQHMEEAEALSDAVTVIDHGRVVADGTPAQLRRQIGGQVLDVSPADPVDLPALVRALDTPGARKPVADQEAGLVRLPVSDEAQLTEALRALSASGVAIARIDTRVPSLNDVFLTLTGTDAGVAA